MKKILLFTIVFILSIASKAETINMQSFGAKADGNVSNTAVIKKAIDKLSQNGGGTLFFPAGTYLTGPIVLKSNITIDIEAGATIKFTDDMGCMTNCIIINKRLIFVFINL